MAGLICSMVFAASSAQADSVSPRFTLPYVGGNVGFSRVQTSDRYNSSGAANVYGGFYVFQNLSIELWAAYLGQFNVKGATNSMYLQSGGLGSALAYRIDMGRTFALRPSVGVFYSQTSLIFDGDEIGRDTGSNLMFGLSGVLTIRNRYLANINTHYYKDVSGVDIMLLTVGAGYQF